MALDSSDNHQIVNQSRSIPPRLRRNGTVPSCENCRVAKARCDHNSPCSRCSRQGKICYFHPSPMSRSRREGVSTGSKRTRSPGENDVASLRNPEHSQSPLTLQSGGSIRHRYKSAGPSQGYMGSTGYAAILEENKHAGLWGDESNDSGDDKSRAESLTIEDESEQDLGIFILARLPPRHICERMMKPTGELDIVRLIRPRRVQYYMKEFWKQYGDLLREPRDQEKLRQVCAALNRNTRRPLPIPHNNAEWISSFSGPNSRWEVLGEFLGIIGDGVFCMPDNAPFMTEILRNHADRRAFACSMLQCADACLTICEGPDFPINLLAATLLSRCVQLQNTTVGASSYDVWKRVGHLVTTTTGLGLHLKANEAESRSSLYYEQRARVFASAFAIDKQIATFMGRPPLLGRRFVSADLVLDLNEDDLWEENDISVLKEKLNEAGWNRNGEIYSTTSVRALTLLRSLRDEILEMSLSVDVPDDLEAKIESLRVRMEQRFQGFPSAFRQTIDRSALSRLSNFDVFRISTVQLVHLQNIFLCERIKHEGRDVTRLLQAAKDMLRIVNTFWGGRDRYVQMRDVCHWWICSYGIPAASALAIDLWNQTSSPLAYAPAADRPQVIQSLSVFMASLDWVEEENGNYKLCQRIRCFLNDILNQALSPQSTNPVPMTLSSYSGWEASDFSFAGMPNFGTNFDDLEGWFNPPMMMTS